MKERAAPLKLRGTAERFRKKLLESAALQRAALHGVYFAAGLICARGVIFGRHGPFGVAAAAGCPRGVLWTTALGSAVGYLLPGAVHSPGRYLIALLLTVALRWTLGDMANLKDKLLFGPIITFCPLMTTGAVLAILNGSTVQTWILYGAESVLGAGTVYFFSRTSQLLGEGKPVGSWNQSELTCAILSLGIGILSLSTVQIGSISIGRVAAVLLILFSCRFGGVVGGSLSGIVAGAMFGLASSGINGISGALAFAGLIAGLFSPLGRVVTAVAFVVANGIGSLQVGSFNEVLNGLYEVMAASLIFVVWPHRVGSQLALVFRQPVQFTQSGGLRRAIVMRLGSAAEALENVSESVEAVSQRLTQVDTTTVESIYRKTMESVCEGCTGRGACWGGTPRETEAICLPLTEALRVEGHLTQADLPEAIRTACTHPEQLIDAINGYYHEYVARESAERKLQQVRSVVTSQFATTGKLLRDMAAEMKLYEKFDTAMASKISHVLHDQAITPLDVSCKLNKEGRMIVEIEGLVMDRYKLTKAPLLRSISKVTGREFSYPCVSVTGEKCRFQMVEKPLYKAVFGVAQHSCKNASLCGDSCVCFEDGTGKQIAIISDGMGTGGRAAVDGAMASGILAKLIQSGIGFDCALQITNSALMVKSGAETLSTLDVASIDLFTGEVQLMKAGAPISYVRKGKEVHRLDAISLPVGILEEAVFCKTSARLGDGDLLVMFSDGVVAAGEEWVAQLIGSWKGTEPSQLANLIVEKAAHYRTDGKEDDITALVLQLTPRPS
ncbi:MAG: SpoIIE family protein phosphatase [Oscillospiraceae bacterium]|nr:SpoIIE family protein phosphatase [Oscillospiraceae bacterium]